MKKLIKKISKIFHTQIIISEKCTKKIMFYRYVKLQFRQNYFSILGEGIKASNNVVINLV